MESKQKDTLPTPDEVHVTSGKAKEVSENGPPSQMMETNAFTSHDKSPEDSDTDVTEEYVPDECSEYKLDKMENEQMENSHVKPVKKRGRKPKEKILHEIQKRKSRSQSQLTDEGSDDDVVCEKKRARKLRQRKVVNYAEMENGPDGTEGQLDNEEHVRMAWTSGYPESRNVAAVESYTSTLARTMFGLQKTGELCNVLLIGKDCYIRAHSVVLASACPRFSSGILASAKKSHSLACCIYLRHLSQIELDSVVQYIYTGELALTPKTAQTLMKTFLHLQLPHAAEECKQYMNKACDTSNQSVPLSQTVTARGEDVESETPGDTALVNAETTLADPLAVSENVSVNAIKDEDHVQNTKTAANSAPLSSQRSIEEISQAQPMALPSGENMGLSRVVGTSSEKPREVGNEMTADDTTGIEEEAIKDVVKDTIKNKLGWTASKKQVPSVNAFPEDSMLDNFSLPPIVIAPLDQKDLLGSPEVDFSKLYAQFIDGSLDAPLKVKRKYVRKQSIPSEGGVILESSPIKKKRGRPKKNPDAPPVPKKIVARGQNPVKRSRKPTGRPRGRPRKNPLPITPASLCKEDGNMGMILKEEPVWQTESASGTPKIKKPRGRKKKILSTESSQSFDEAADDDNIKDTSQQGCDGTDPDWSSSDNKVSQIIKATEKAALGLEPKRRGGPTGKRGGHKTCRKCHVTFDSPEECASHRKLCKIRLPVAANPNSLVCARCGDEFPTPMEKKLHVKICTEDPGDPAEAPQDSQFSPPSYHEYHGYEHEESTDHEESSETDLDHDDEYHEHDSTDSKHDHNNDHRDHGKDDQNHEDDHKHVKDYDHNEDHELQHSEDDHDHDDSFPPAEEEKVSKVHLKCHGCKYQGKDQEDIVKHRAEHKKEWKKVYIPKRNARRRRQYTCDLCGKGFVFEWILVNHRASKHGVPLSKNGKFPVIQCEQCDYQTLQRYMLRKHIAIRHENRGNVICEICGKTFASNYYLSCHIRNIHEKKMPVFQCQHCVKTFKSKISLQKHLDVKHSVSKASLFQCDQCEFSTNYDDTLKSHQFRKHDIPLPDHFQRYDCEFCGYFTRHRNQYHNHLRRHTGEKPFKCPECGKSFPAKSDLTSHRKWHIDKSLKCPYENCKYSTASKTSLTNHVKVMHTHKHEKPWACHVCHYRTNIRGNLRLHLKNVHKMQVEGRKSMVVPEAKTKIPLPSACEYMKPASPVQEKPLLQPQQSFAAFYENQTSGIVQQTLQDTGTVINTAATAMMSDGGMLTNPGVSSPSAPVIGETLTVMTHHNFATQVVSSEGGQTVVIPTVRTDGVAQSQADQEVLVHSVVVPPMYVVDMASQPKDGMGMLTHNIVLPSIGTVEVTSNTQTEAGVMPHTVVVQPCTSMETATVASHIQTGDAIVSQSSEATQLPYPSTYIIEGQQQEITQTLQFGQVFPQNL